ncbi:MAG: B12-binding domain-containing radical SAM protein [Desulfobacterales bacterium]
MPTICLVNPVGAEPPARSELLKGYLSLGLLASALRDQAFLATFAARAGLAPAGAVEPFDVRVVHLGPAADPERMAAAYRRAFQTLSPPLLVGVTATADRVAWARAAARAADLLWPTVPRIAGGPHPSTAAEDFLSAGAFHAVCRGEGVETLAEAALRLGGPAPPDWMGTPGLISADPVRGLRCSPPRRFVCTPDDYPPASRSLDLFLPGGRREALRPEEIVFLWAGHGCPHRCGFCAQHAIFRGAPRERSAASLFAEIVELHALGYRNFALVQETFFNRRERVEEFLRRIDSAGIAFQWTAEARCDQLDRRLLERLRAAGLKMIQIGLESGDPEVLARIGKGFSIEEAAQRIADCRELGIDTGIYLLVGLPGQDWRSVLRSARFLERHPPRNEATSHVAVAVALPYPGTRIARERSVRLCHPGPEGGFPQRTPRVWIDERGELQVEPITETDCLSGVEISEAFFFLDDFLHFRLASRSGDAVPRRREMQEYATRLLTMIVHRAIRDLALQDPRGSAAARRRALAEILRRHGPETRLAEMTAPQEVPLAEELIDFLCHIRLAGGRRALSAMPWRGRFELVRFAARCWTAAGRGFHLLAITPDDEAGGRRLAEALSAAASLGVRRPKPELLIIEAPPAAEARVETGRPSWM